MSSSDLVRWGGLAAMLAGVAFIVLLLIPVAFMVLKLIPDAYPGSPFNVLGSVLFIAAWLLLHSRDLSHASAKAAPTG